MATRRDLQPHPEGYRLARLKPPVGYMLPEGQRAEDVLAVYAGLLRSEGLDPTWRGFDESRPQNHKQ
jgi:hypothetical protein